MKYISTFVLALALSACGGESITDAGNNESPATPEFSVSQSGVKTKNVEGFGGVIAESYQDSQEWWAAEERPK